MDECERAKRQLGPENRVTEFDRLKAQKDAIFAKPHVCGCGQPCNGPTTAEQPDWGMSADAARAHRARESCDCPSCLDVKSLAKELNEANVALAARDAERIDAQSELVRAWAEIARLTERVELRACDDGTHVWEDCTPGAFCHCGLARLRPDSAGAWISGARRVEGGES